MTSRERLACQVRALIVDAERAEKTAAARTEKARQALATLETGGSLADLPVIFADEDAARVDRRVARYDALLAAAYEDEIQGRGGAQ